MTLAATGAPEQGIEGVDFLSLPPNAGNRLRRIVFGKGRLLRRLRALQADIYHAHDPELLPVILALRMMGKRVVYDAHEHLRDSLASKPYLHPCLGRIVAAGASAVEAFVARRCAVVVAATPVIGAQFPGPKTRVIHNYPIVEELATPPRDLADFVSRPPHGIYVGTLTQLRRADEMFAASDMLCSRYPDGRLIVAGETYQVSDPTRHPGVEYLGVVPAARVSELLRCARFGVVLLADIPAYVDALPTKFFEYAAAGLPVISTRSTTSIAAIVAEHDCGLIVDGRDPDEVAKAMLWLLEHPEEAFEMGQRGAHAVRSRYNWETEAKKLVEAYRQLEAQ